MSWAFHSVVGVLMDFLNGDGAMDVILFVRSIVQQYEVGFGLPSERPCFPLLLTFEFPTGTGYY